MRETWLMIWCLTCAASICCVGGLAMGQTGFAAPQNPQPVQYPQGAPPVTPAVSAAPVTLTADQIDQLLGPIALYPDPLLSLIFPAASFPQDVTAAEQWLDDTPNPTEADIDAQSWDASVKGLVHYPTVLKMMSDQIDWTTTVGAAFVSQQQGVLDSVQRLRAQAQAAKNLQTNQQEQVVTDDGAIRIEPVDPDTIYVPQYDPNLVYASACPVVFGFGYPIGLWCDYDFDWHDHYIVTGGGWYGGWHHPAAWDRNPPAWNRHPAGWAAAPKPWARAALRAAPRLTPAAVSHLGLDRPRGATGVKPVPGAARKLSAPLPIGKQAAPAPSKNVFNPTNTRAGVQHAVQRAHPAPAKAAPARAAPARAAPARSSAFHGGSGGATRAQSARGNASAHRK